MMTDYANARHGHTPMTVESILFRRIHTKSPRYDKIRGVRMAYTLDVGAKRPEFVLQPGDVQLIEGQPIHIVRWKPGSSAIVAMLNGGHGTPVHMQPMSWFGVTSMALINNGMVIFSCVTADLLAPLLLLGLGSLVVNAWLTHDIRARLKLNRAVEALRDFHQLRMRLGFQTERR